MQQGRPAVDLNQEATEGKSYCQILFIFFFVQS